MWRGIYNEQLVGTYFFYQIFKSLIYESHTPRSIDDFASSIPAAFLQAMLLQQRRSTIFYFSISHGFVGQEFSEALKWPRGYNSLKCNTFGSESTRPFFVVSHYKPSVRDGARAKRRSAMQLLPRMSQDLTVNAEESCRLRKGQAPVLLGYVFRFSLTRYCLFLCHIFQ